VNVFIYAMSILETFGIDREEKLHYGLGAILHDIGKLRISPMVLNKPGNLTNAEWELVKTHPVEGVGLCTRISLSQAAINCILFHHEKYDGSGYPVGLAGENIPFPARVTAVADVYDALTTKRVYGEARTPYEALMEMKGEMNQAFEPEILKRLVLVLSGAEIIKGGDGLV
jgi:HD-GYP domain-containing protein (c-di-GMP phosphodiesterase class II)